MSDRAGAYRIELTWFSAPRDEVAYESFQCDRYTHNPGQRVLTLQGVVDCPPFYKSKSSPRGKATVPPTITLAYSLMDRVVIIPMAQ